ncbi:MAG: hypothetical protein R3324_00165 [Halobacteriales archaeon]|nr:hypothetical protein [Halobacteriales archaeon]
MTPAFVTIRGHLPDGGNIEVTIPIPEHWECAGWDELEACADETLTEYGGVKATHMTVYASYEAMLRGEEKS